MPDGVPFLLVSLDISDILLLQLLKSMVETGLTALSSNRKAPDSADARHMNGQTGGHYGRHFLQKRIIYLGVVFRHFHSTLHFHNRRRRQLMIIAHYH